MKEGVSGSIPRAARGGTSSRARTTQRARRFSVPISVMSNPAPPSRRTRRASGLRPGRARLAGTASYQVEPTAAGEVDDEEEAVGLDGHELAPTIDVGDGPALQGIEGWVERLEGREGGELAGFDGPAGEVPPEGSGERLDLGKLGHLPIVACQRAVVSPAIGAGRRRTGDRSSHRRSTGLPVLVVAAGVPDPDGRSNGRPFRAEVDVSTEQPTGECPCSVRSPPTPTSSPSRRKSSPVGRATTSSPARSR